MSGWLMRSKRTRKLDTEPTRATQVDWAEFRPQPDCPRRSYIGSGGQAEEPIRKRNPGPIVANQERLLASE